MTKTWCKLAGLVSGLLLFSTTLCAQSPRNEANRSGDTVVASETAASAKKERVTAELARLQAASLHDVVHSTLQITHDRYYREDEGLPLPAAVLKDVFADLKQNRGITLRWLVVEGQAMNTDHNPQNDFEEDAAKALKSGKSSYEQIENGIYRRVGPITLSNHCLKCHVPDRRSTRDRTAGLLITIPVKPE